MIDSLPHNTQIHKTDLLIASTPAVELSLIMQIHSMNVYIPSELMR